MNSRFVGVLCLFAVWTAFAQNKPAAGNAPAAAKPLAPAATIPGVTNKPDIKELVKGDSFTNSSDMVMVKISPTLWAGKYLVTQEDYRKVVGGSPSAFTGDRKPVDSVSWNDALAFCSRLTEMERKEDLLPEGFVYSLPTQDQWERLVAGAPLDQAVTSVNTSRSGTADVGSLGANGLGLYDVRGNVWQWCLDPTDKPYRVLRGGAWKTSIEINIRPEFRWYSDGPDDRQNYYGFRVVLVPAQP